LIARERYITEYQKGGFTCVGVTLSVNNNREKTLKTISEWEDRFAYMRDELLHILDVKDIQRAHEENKLGILFHFQNTAPLEGDLGMVEQYHDLGVRVMQITYNGSNQFGCGCEVKDTGLTELGHELVDEMNKTGMVVDVSHAGYKTALDAITSSQVPVILSHSNALTLCQSDRNVPDEVIQEIAKNGGAIGLNGFTPLVTKDVEQADLNQLLDHAEYIAKMVGVEHLSLGLDYYTGQWPYVSTEVAVKNYNLNIKRGIWKVKNYPKPPHKWVDGLETPDKIGNLKPALLERGFTNKEVNKILAGNLVRVFSNVWH